MGVVKNHGVQKGVKKNGVHKVVKNHGVHKVVKKNGVHKVVKNHGVQKVVKNHGVHKVVKKNVQFDSIPIWGVCHRRIGNNVILVDEIPGGGENGNSYSGTRCFKCFNLVLRSANVLQIHTSGLD